MVFAMFLILTILAVYAGIFMGGFGWRMADYFVTRRDPEAVKRWSHDQRYLRLLMGRRKI